MKTISLTVELQIPDSADATQILNTVEAVLDDAFENTFLEELQDVHAITYKSQG